MDYDDLYNATWENIPEAVNLPDGGYLVKGVSVGFIKPREEGKSGKVLFTYNAKQPVSVDEDALADLPTGYDLETNDLNYTIWISKPSDWNDVRSHLALHGVEIAGPIFVNGKLAFAKDFRGSEAIAQVTTTFYENNAGETVPQQNLKSFQRVEA